MLNSFKNSEQELLWLAFLQDNNNRSFAFELLKPAANSSSKKFFYRYLNATIEISSDWGCSAS